MRTQEERPEADRMSESDGRHMPLFEVLQASCCSKTDWLAGKYQEGKAAVPPPGIINTQEKTSEAMEGIRKIALQGRVCEPCLVL